MSLKAAAGDTLSPILFESKTYAQASKTSSMNRHLFSMDPPYSSLLLFALFRKN